MGTLLTSGLVEVEKVADGDAEGFGPEEQRGGMRGAKYVIEGREALRHEQMAALGGNGAGDASEKREAVA